MWNVILWGNTDSPNVNKALQALWAFIVANQNTTLLGFLHGPFAFISGSLMNEMKNNERRDWFSTVKHIYSDVWTQHLILASIEVQQKKEISRNKSG